MIDKKNHRPRRRWPIFLLALGLLVGGVALVLRHYTRPDQLTALLIAQARSALDADLAIDGTATFGFSPDLGVVLPHPSLKAHGSGAIMLRADGVRAIVPWKSLWSSRYDIERIDLVKPVLDIGALNAWLAARAPSSTAPPDVRFTLHVEDGILMSAGKTIAQGVTMTFANSGDLTAWLANIQSTSTSAIPPLNGSAQATSLQFGDTRLDDVHIDVQGDVVTPTATKQP